MSSEAQRGCGYRKVYGLYLVGDAVMLPCDRMPFELDVCPCCGEGIPFPRSPKRIDAMKLFGVHDDSLGGCVDNHDICYVCNPKLIEDRTCFIFGVGEKYYTPESFLKEAQELGVSKRIKMVPKDMEIGKSIIFLSHLKAIVTSEEVETDDDGEPIRYKKGAKKGEIKKKVEGKHAIFMAFIPKRLEMPVWERDTKNEEFMKRLEERGITPVAIPDGDKDHKEVKTKKGSKPKDQA